MSFGVSRGLHHRQYVGLRFVRQLHRAGVQPVRQIGVRVLKGGRARLSAHAHLELAAFSGRLVGNQNSYSQTIVIDVSDAG